MDAQLKMFQHVKNKRNMGCAFLLQVYRTREHKCHFSYHSEYKWYHSTVSHNGFLRSILSKGVLYSTENTNGLLRSTVSKKVNFRSIASKNGVFL